MNGIAWALLLSLPLAVGEDWPHVRGPTYDAISSETGLADRWPSIGPPILWTRELGPGYSSLVVARGKAFTLYQTTAGMFVIALDVDTGETVWKQRIDWPWQPGGMYPGPYASPTWHEGRVYYATPTGSVGCLEDADGRQVWQINLREKFGSKGTEFGFASTPAVEEGLVLFPVGGDRAAMVALHARDGSVAWASGNDPASYCPAYPITFEGRRLVVGFFKNSLVAFDLKTGAVLWREVLSTSYDEHAAWPLFDGRHLLIASPFRVGAQLFQWNQANDSLQAIARWSGRQLSNDVCSSLLYRGAVYGFDLQQSQASPHRASRGKFKCLDFVSGKVHWEAPGIAQCSVLAADGKLILWTETGELILAKPNPDRYEELARAKILSGGGMCWAAPAMSNKRLLVRDHKQVFSIYLGPPEELDPGRPVVLVNAEDHDFDWTRLVPREPEFPNDAPPVSEIAHSFAWSVGILLLAGAVALPSRWLIGPSYQAPIFAMLAFGLGAIGTTLIGHFLDLFVWTWPVSLYVAFRSVVALGLGDKVTGWRHEVIGRLALIIFMIFCYLYYRFCMAVGYGVAWGFLFGLLPVLPFTILAQKISPSSRWHWCLEILAFVVYFWSSGLFPSIKAAWTR